MLQVAQMFYQRNISRRDIAKALHIESRKVTALLKASLKSGLVKIIIDETSQTDLGPQLKQKYNLKDVIVTTPPANADIREQMRGWGVAAAQYLDKLVRESASERRDLHVSVTGGEMFYEFASALTDVERPNVYLHVSALIGHGRFPTFSGHIHPATIAGIIASRSGRLPGHLEFVTVSPYEPGKPDHNGINEKVAEELGKVRKNVVVKEVVQGMDRLDVVFGGVGIVNPKGLDQSIRSRVTMETFLANIVDPETLEAQGAVGDFSYCPFDKNGKTRPHWRLFLTAGEYSSYKGIEFFKHMVATPGKLVVGMGGGPQLPAIKVALKSRIINVLITDEATARQIVESD